MNIDELNQEVLECSRYGEDEDLKAVLAAGADANYSDEAGNTGLHRASANGNVECIRILLDQGAIHQANVSGNFPIHWAAQNGQLEALKLLLERCPDCDVLAQNSFGRSVITEAFDSKNTDVIEACISHPSAAEDKLLNNNKSKESASETIPEESETEDSEANAIHHEFNFNVNTARTMKIRELPISRADNPFGSDTKPEDDTTGLGIWPASLLASRWIAMSDDLKHMIQDKVFVELGAGCGVPAIAAACYCVPRIAYITDINDRALENAAYNVEINSVEVPLSTTEDSQESSKYIAEGLVPSLDNTSSASSSSSSSGTILRVHRLNWLDASSFPPGPVDVVLGSDLVYESRILVPLTTAVAQLLSIGGKFLYVAPDENRDGMDDLIVCLKAAGLSLQQQMPCPPEYYENPLTGEDRDDRYVLHFYDLPAMKSFSLYIFTKES